MSEVKTPWKDYVGDVPMHLDYFQGSMFDAVARIAEEYPNNIAFDFMGRSTTYRKMVQEIEKCAKSLKTLGVRPGDKITIAMPNCPQAIYMFYAVNLVGGIANMIHPLSAGMCFATMSIATLQRKRFVPIPAVAVMPVVSSTSGMIFMARSCAESL